MIDDATLERWIERLGFRATREDASVRRLRRNDLSEETHLFLQVSENWVLLSILPVLPPGAASPADLYHLLRKNREMRVAKFAIGSTDEVVLCAELPTESLQYEELADAIERMIDYLRGHLA